MRGQLDPQSDMVCLVSPESFVPADHPLRLIKPLADQALQRLSPKLDTIYAELGRPSIPPERLLKAKLLQAFFTIRSETLLVEAIHYNLLFRWFLDMNLTDRVWDNSSFTTNQERLLAHRVAQEFFGEIADLARERGWLSDAHFTVDGTLIQAWASLKSFAPKDGQRKKTDDDPGNPSVDFKGQKRSNATHQSTTDPEARLAKKAAGQEAKLSYSLHVLMENRHGLCAGLEVTRTSGTAETEAAQTLLRRQKKEQKQTPHSVGADKGYHNAEFVTYCRKAKIAPHIATRADRQVKGLDGRTTRTKNYQTSQHIRKRVEECIGWIKEIGGLRRVKVRGTERVGLHAWLVGCAYNLVRMGKLMEASPPAMAAA
jgi:transposase/IS5 family transposase